MTSTDRLRTGVIAALLAVGARLYEIKAALGVVIVCVAFATTIEVMMATTVAMRMTPGRENFWIRIVIAFIFCGVSICGSLRENTAKRQVQSGAMKYWQIIADNLSKAGWSWGCVSAVDCNGRTIFVADAHHGDGKRFVVRADEKLTAFVELEAAIRESGLRNESERPVGLRFGGCKWQTIPPSL